MVKNMKKVICGILCMLMVFSMFTVSAATLEIGNITVSDADATTGLRTVTIPYTVDVDDDEEAPAYLTMLASKDEVVDANNIGTSAIGIEQIANDAAVTSISFVTDKIEAGATYYVKMGATNLATPATATFSLAAAGGDEGGDDPVVPTTPVIPAENVVVATATNAYKVTGGKKVTVTLPEGFDTTKYTVYVDGVEAVYSYECGRFIAIATPADAASYAPAVTVVEAVPSKRVKICFPNLGDSAAAKPNMGDMAATYKIFRGTLTGATDIQRIAADADGNAAINMGDMQAIYRYWRQNIVPNGLK